MNPVNLAIKIIVYIAFLDVAVTWHFASKHLNVWAEFVGDVSMLALAIYTGKRLKRLETKKLFNKQLDKASRR